MRNFHCPPVDDGDVANDSTEPFGLGRAANESEVEADFDDPKRTFVQDGDNGADGTRVGMVGKRFKSGAIVGGLYFVAAAAAVLLTRYEGGVAFLWVACSILVADLLDRPRRFWLWSIVPCAIAGFLVTGLFGLGWAMAAPFAAANIVEAMLAAWLFRRFADSRRPLGSLDWLMQLIASVGIAGPAVAGLIAATSATFIGLSFGSTLMTFFFGHALGNLTFTPLAILLSRSNRKDTLLGLARRDKVEVTALMLLALATFLAVFYQRNYPTLFLPILPMILIAFRIGKGGVAIGIAMLALVGGCATVTGHGPMQLIDAPFGRQMQFFQFYLAVTVLALLPVTAELANRGRLHRKLRESETGFRLIADHSSDSIFSLKVDGTIRYASPSCLQFGYEPRALIGRNCSMLMAPEHLASAAEAHLRSLSMRGETNRFEYFAVNASGERRWAETHARLIIDDEGNPDGILSIVRDIHAQKLTELKLSEAALIDSLTGLSNRMAYREAVDRRQRQKGEIGACVAMLDIDYFKSVNDRYGHDAGDIVLRGFADVARRIVREGDVLARLGGEEFAIFFPETTLPQALAICDRLRSALGSTVFRAGHHAIAVTVSGGVAQLGEEGIDAALKIADMALYRAKQAGRNQLALAA